ncbi:MAG: 5-formyltetrahydrofolate cyclo-ligase [Alphaproteobacteria bacterium]|uniref:5-formyltetrahydrofolate cyclo-ligase n=1 Tax=Candidatus Nitrobium versatile TaxID=2884831 RepID=A0A953M2D0_9BACT|nr:5-formyltetrahydrofolate cyclo-ligase [Candidatus Nitrobium versatile]
MIPVKASIRREVLSRRDSIASALRSGKDEAIRKSLYFLSAYQSARFILLYASFRSEVDTFEMIRHCLTQGKRVALPRVDSAKGELFLYEIRGMDDLAAGCWGIREPIPSPERERGVQEMDLIIVPGVAFDEQCNRLGYGKGYYDKLLREKRAKAVALAYEEQIVASLPAETHDIKMDAIITDQRTIVNCGH